MIFGRSTDVLERSAIALQMSQSWPSQPLPPLCSFELEDLIYCPADNQSGSNLISYKVWKWIESISIRHCTPPIGTIYSMRSSSVLFSPNHHQLTFSKIRYTSTPTPVSQMANICDYIWNLHRKRGRTSSGIIYCRTRATCDELSAYLRGRGLNSRPYHKGLRYTYLPEINWCLIECCST